jgi:hypothetical protein
MRILVIPFITLILLPAAAQGQRPGKKPGEIITPPDVSQGRFGDDLLEVGKPAPPFSLQLLKPAASAAPDKEKSRTSAPGTISLAELHAKKPAVLVFGSMTCPPFKGQLAAVDDVFSGQAGIVRALAHAHEHLGRDRKLVAPADVWAVVKADGYGHGAVQVARAVRHVLHRIDDWHDVMFGDIDVLDRLLKKLFLVGHFGSPCISNKESCGHISQLSEAHMCIHACTRCIL